MNVERLRLLGPSLILAALFAVPVLVQGASVGSGEAVTVVAVVTVLALGSTQLADSVDRRLLVAATVVAGASIWRFTSNEIAFTLGWIFRVSAPWFLLHLLVRQIDATLPSRVRHVLVRTMYLVPLAGGAVWSVTWSPSQGWRSIDGPTLVGSLGDDYLMPTFDVPWAAETADAIVTFVLLIAALAVWLGMVTKRRQQLVIDLPLTAAASGYVGALGLDAAGMYLWAGDLLAPNGTAADRALVLLFDPLSVLVCSGGLGVVIAFAPALRRALLDARVAPLGGADHPIDDVRLIETLRHLIDDPRLEVRFCQPGPATDPPRPEATMTEIISGRRPIAWIEHRHDANPAAVELAAHVLATALDNAAHHAALRAAATDLERSKARIAQAAEAERTRFAAQAQGEPRRLLDEASRLLVGAERSGHDADPSRVIDARTRLDRALTQLRTLAHGLRPAVLTDLGLLAALDELAERSVVPCVVESDHLERIEPEVEAAAYSLAQTSLAQVGPVGLDGSVRIDVRISGQELVMVIDAPLHPESLDLGLVDDRVAALGGRLTVAPRARGLRATAHLPASVPAVTA